MTTLGKTLTLCHGVIVAALLVMVAPTPTVHFESPTSKRDVVAEQLSIITEGRDCSDTPFLTDHVIVEKRGLVTEVTFDAALAHDSETTVLAYCQR